MAQQNLSGLVPLPFAYQASVGIISSSNVVLIDASGEQGALIIQAPKTGNLRKVGFRTGTVVQAQTIRVSFQGIDLTTGFPDGVQDQFRDISIADTDDNVWKLTGFISSDGTDGGSLRAVTKGDFLAIVFEHNPFNAGDVFRLQCIEGIGTSTALPYTANKVGAGPTWDKINLKPNLALLYDDDSVAYLPLCGVFSAATVESYSSGERGRKISVPFPTKLAGVAIGLTTLSADVKINLYDSDETTLLKTITVDKESLTVNSLFAPVLFDAPVSLGKDTNYYICLAPASAAAIAWISVTVDQAAYLGQVSGGQNWNFVSRATEGSGAFTVAATKTPTTILPIFSAFDDGVGGSDAASGSRFNRGLN